VHQHQVVERHSAKRHRAGIPGDGANRLTVPNGVWRLEYCGSSDARHGGSEQLHRCSLDDRHAAAEAPEIQGAGAQCHDPAGGQQQAVEFHRAARGCQTHNEHDACRPQKQSQPLQDAQTFSQQRPGEQRRQQRVERLHQRDRRRSRADHRVVCRHQQHGIREHAGDGTMPPISGEPAPGPPQQKGEAQQDGGRQH
jgi:hypothetical protein